MPSPRQPRNVISVRFSDDEYAKVKAAAEKSGQPVSTVIRNAALTPAATFGHVSSGTMNGSLNRAPDIQLSGSGVDQVSMQTSGLFIRV